MISANTGVKEGAEPQGQNSRVILSGELWIDRLRSVTNVSNVCRAQPQNHSTDSAPLFPKGAGSAELSLCAPKHNNDLKVSEIQHCSQDTLTNV